MIRLLLADVHPLQNPAVYGALYSEASVERRMAADRYRFAADRRLSIGAAALLDAGLQRFGLREKDMSYGKSDKGKPFFINAPEIYFSISHSSAKVAVAFSDCEVGCDIELVTEMDTSVAERFFSRDEFESGASFFRIWTLKESYMKATGLGLSLPPESFSVLGELPDSGFRLQAVNSFDGYECALCYHAQCGEPEIEMILL